MPIAKCDNCGRVFDFKDDVNPLDKIDDLTGRIDVGGIVPAADCPICGGLSYCIDISAMIPTQVYTIEKYEHFRLALGSMTMDELMGEISPSAFNALYVYHHYYYKPDLIQKILDEAEEKINVRDMAEDRAFCGNWPAPQHPEDYLMWIEDEVQVQRDTAEEDPDLNAIRIGYAAILDGIAKQLRDLGVKPIKPYWEKG